MLEGNMIGNYWDREWEDASTGKLMVGRGTEFWTIRDGKVSIWEAAFNVWERDAPPRPPCSYIAAISNRVHAHESNASENY